MCWTSMLHLHRVEQDQVTERSCSTNIVEQPNAGTFSFIELYAFGMRYVTCVRH